MPEKYKLKYKGSDEGVIVADNDSVKVCGDESDASTCIVARDAKAKEIAIEYFRLFGFSVEEA